MCLCLLPRFRVRSLLSLLAVCGLLFSYQRGFCDPLDTPVQDGSGAVWANHDSDDGAYKQLSFQSILGVGYRIEKSNNLVNWTNFAQFYGVGNTVTWNLEPLCKSCARGSEQRRKSSPCGGGYEKECYACNEQGRYRRACPWMDIP